MKIQQEKIQIEYTGKNKKNSKHGNRFYTSVDMSIIKHDIAVRNAKIKRGEARDLVMNILQFVVVDMKFVLFIMDTKQQKHKNNIINH